MSTATMTVGSMLVLLLLSLVLNFGSLLLVARWFAAPHRSWRRLLLIEILLLAIGVFSAIAEKAASATLATSWCWLLIVPVFILEAAIVKECLGLTWKRGTAALFIWMFLALVTGYGIAIPYVKFLVQSFRTGTSMGQAPTLLGVHLVGKCPHCGGEVYLGYESRPHIQSLPELGICGTCWRASEQLVNWDETPKPSDSFLVNKIAPIRRWDVIVHDAPDNPGVLYVKRLVGLPGEEVVIRDDAIWLDGERVEPPVPLRPMLFDEHMFEKIFGSAREPVRLGPDEYFVLGDFAERSLDSRTFGPVRRDQLRGVVSVIYWPPSRMGVVK